MDKCQPKYPATGGFIGSPVIPDLWSSHRGFDPVSGCAYYFDKLPSNIDLCDRLAIAMMDAQLAQADDHAHRLLLESQVDALESEMHERGIIDDLDIVADLISIPGLNRVDFDSLEGVDDESDDEIYGTQQSPAGQDEPEG